MAKMLSPGNRTLSKQGLPYQGSRKTSDRPSHFGKRKVATASPARIEAGSAPAAAVASTPEPEPEPTPVIRRRRRRTTTDQ